MIATRALKPRPPTAPCAHLLVDPEHVGLVGHQLGLLDAVVDACTLRQRSPAFAAGTAGAVGRDGAAPQLRQNLGGALAPSDLAEQLSSRTTRHRKKKTKLRLERAALNHTPPTECL